MPIIIQFVIGLVFGLGLIISGMADPLKVQNFLDLAAIRAGTWDASLAFVMIGAIVVAFIGLKLILKRSKPIFGDLFHLPKPAPIDSRLLAGPALFGIGWGLAGFCPGPALTALGMGASGTFLFVPAMLIGMVGARWLAHRIPLR